MSRGTIIAANRIQYRDSVDPEYRHWGKKYPRFPGVAECVRLIQEGKATGAWSDIIVYELAEHAAACLPELVVAYREASNDRVQLYVMLALDTSYPPEAVPFLADVLREGIESHAALAKSALQGIDTREARTALWDAEHG